MRSYMKKREKVETEILYEDFEVSKPVGKMKYAKALLLSILVGVVVLPVALVFKSSESLNAIEIADEAMVHLVSAPAAATATKKGTISIPAGIVKANPFLPYRDIGGSTSVSDVPEFTLVPPPEEIDSNSDAARVMDTIVSGILYDKFSPSAILNIEGNDYLVKKGDVVNNYKVVNIVQDSVTVKLGNNTYKAGIGEILTEGTLNHNNVPNLNNKFGGVQ